MLTEQMNPNTSDLDRLSTLEMVQRINNEDLIVAQKVQEELPQIARAVDGITRCLSNGGRLIYIGAGTSGRLGVLDAVECLPTFSVAPDIVQGVIAGGEVALTHSVEGAEDDMEAGINDLKARNINAKDVIVGIAASGRTPYVLSAMNYAREIGALTVGIACNKPAPLLEVVDLPIGIQVGPEVLAGSTRMKSGTAQKMVLNMISTASMVKLGKVYGNLMIDVQITNDKLAIRARNILMQITGLDENTASELLKKAGGSVKTAVVMHKKDVDCTTAEEIIAEHRGFLRSVFDAQGNEDSE